MDLNPDLPIADAPEGVTLIVARGPNLAVAHKRDGTWWLGRHDETRFREELDFSPTHYMIRTGKGAQ